MCSWKISYGEFIKQMCLSILHLLLISFWIEFKNIMIWHHLLRFNWVFNLNRNIDNYFIIQWYALAKTCNPKIYSFFKNSLVEKTRNHLQCCISTIVVKMTTLRPERMAPTPHLFSLGISSAQDSPLIWMGNLLSSGHSSYTPLPND